MSKKKIFMTIVMIGAMAAVGCNDGSKNDESNGSVYTVENGEVNIKVSQGHNPIAGFSDSGDYTYGGDPSVLVDGDTVYLYTGHDLSSDNEVNRAIYNIPEYLCYSTKDLINWTAEGAVFAPGKSNVKWVNDSTTAWASQVTKHYDREKGKDLYYLYYCSWDRTSHGKQSIGVAVAESPTGPFEDIGHPLVKGTLTAPESNAWNDIDPTVWFETDESGEEHRYLAWGNSKFYICELNEDMISVKDINGDGQITCGNEGDSADIINHQTGLNAYTEAPWIYRRQDSEGNYYGDYYLFYANGWHERMAYATTDDLLNGKWDFGTILMMPTATSNTNHMAVFDFKGKTYFVYHNGSLPAGNGYRRSPCIAELHFNEDGSVSAIPETAAGIQGTIFNIFLKSDENKLVSHEYFTNSANDNEYPYLDVKVGINVGNFEADAQWVIVSGKADSSDKAYVSIQSENKPGLYLTANEDGSVTLAQDTDGDKNSAARQTFHTVEGLDGEGGISFESVSQPGKYLTIKDGTMCLTDGEDTKNAVFDVKITDK